MKAAVIIPFAAAAAGLFRQVPLLSDELPSWPALDSIVSEAKNSLSLTKDSFDPTVDELLDPGNLHVTGPHRKPNLTIYELISKSNHTTKFAKLVGESDELVELLNSTKVNSTLFVPVDSAFDKIPDDDKKPSKEFVEALLKYHVGDDAYGVQKLVPMHTVPTVLKEGWLGGRAQRLRVRVGLMGIHVNLHSKVMVANVPATNGVVHLVNHILVPPAMVGREISLFPTAFSTLLHAYEKTDFVHFIHHVPMTEGSTVFAPDNAAFAKLGARANAFLFNTEKGLKCLRALLKYQIVANVTVYSDVVYNGTAEEGEVGREMMDKEHIELETLLDGEGMGVDVFKWHGLIAGMRVNKRVGVKVQDVIAKNGVVQVVDHVPVPPHKHKKEQQQELDFEGDISVEELEERLWPYVEDEEMGDDEL
ncbi:uncharacterized protein MKZ38_001013 [Zalerion maritima]|uniref:FAS1 domain-containing protein n=1 Tax=Zalerion maritima TaxID=339359 RepID=A0AAD5RQR4_9PEZI|nr:uncharacterized protein MKZ38_001013 [Zalerion maritima]